MRKLSVLTCLSVLLFSLYGSSCLAEQSEQNSEQEKLQKIDKSIAELADKGEFSGVALLARDGEILFHKAYGMANRRYDVPNKLDTKFNLGSMNKMFTAVAMAQLVDQGKLAFDDPIGKYLGTDWVSEEVGKKVTIAHLLSHTSGFGNYFTEEFFTSSRTLYRETEDYKSLITDELAFEPGTRWQYSNSGMFLVGAIIEKVSGQNYFEYIRKNIYEPAGMTNSDCYDMDEPVKNLAMGYFVDDDGKTKNNMFLHSIRGGPAGGGFSTAPDLLNFDKALRSGKLVNKDSLEILWTVKPNTNDYGFGFGIHGEIVGHSGGFPGINSILDIYRESGYTVIVMANFGSMRPVRKILEEALAEM